VTLRAVADTHAAIWYLFGDPRLSAPARAVFEEAAENGDEIGVSAITLVEIVYLAEKERIPAGTLPRILAALAGGESVLAEMAVDSTVARAMLEIPRSDVPDLPDRVIAATAFGAHVPLISRDRRITLSRIPTIW
jgi:PIN domain nuclease of toxin-antitoxin system